MKKAKVKVTRVQGIGRKTYVLGEVVSASDFPEGNFDKLVEGGYLALLEDKKSEPKKDEKKDEKKPETKSDKK